MEHEKLKQRAEQGKMQFEKAKFNLEFHKLNLMKEGKLSSSGQEQSMCVFIFFFFTRFKSKTCSEIQ